MRVTEWFEEYTQRNWYCIDPNEMELIEEIGGTKHLINLPPCAEGPTEFPPPETWFFNDEVHKLNHLLKWSGTSVYPLSSLGHWGSSGGRITPEQIGQYYRSTLPLLARAANVLEWY